jgi:hypothetical protein
MARLRALLCFTVLFMSTGATYVAAEESTVRFQFLGSENIEMMLTLTDQRNITGKLQRSVNATADDISGQNVSPGKIRITLPDKREHVYRKRICNDAVSKIYRNPDCGVDVWVSQNAPPGLKRFRVCDDTCKFFSEIKSDDEERFVAAIDWATDGDVQPFSFQGYEKGSPVALSVFKSGTFLKAPGKSADVKFDEAKAAKGVIASTLERPGLKVAIRAGSRGNTDYIVTIIGRSPQLDFPSGYWFKSRLQIGCFFRSESQADTGSVEQMELHVIGTKIFRGPASANPSDDQFQPIARVDRRLDDGPVDSALALSIANLFADQLNGTVSQAPEGL